MKKLLFTLLLALPLMAIAQEKIKVADGTAEKKELMKQQDELKKKMIKEISEL